MKWIKLGTWLELLIEFLTMGQGERIALWIAKKVFGKNECGCCQRKEWLNRLTDKSYYGHCDEIKIF